MQRSEFKMQDWIYLELTDHPVSVLSPSHRKQIVGEPGRKERTHNSESD